MDRRCGRRFPLLSALRFIAKGEEMAQSTLQKLKNQWAAETRDEEKLAAHLVMPSTS